jgi:hypothetical protein
MSNGWDFFSILLEKIAQWEKLKTLVFDSVSSPITKRVYNMALNESPRPGFTKATVSARRAGTGVFRWLPGRDLGTCALYELNARQYTP